jgi:hypothetical protein
MTMKVLTFSTVLKQTMARTKLDSAHDGNGHFRVPFRLFLKKAATQSTIDLLL